MGDRFITSVGAAGRAKRIDSYITGGGAEDMNGSYCEKRHEL